MSEVAVNLQTPILKSVRDRLKELQEEHGHETIGETIAHLLDGELSDDAMKVVDMWTDRHGFATRNSALQDMVRVSQDRCLDENESVGV